MALNFASDTCKCSFGVVSGTAKDTLQLKRVGYDNFQYEGCFDRDGNLKKKKKKRMYRINSQVTRELWDKLLFF